MTTTDILVLLGGGGLIIFILWFFFGPRKAQGVALAPRGKEKLQVVTIVVEGAYTPSEIVVKKGIPVEITFDRRESGDCSEWVVFGKLKAQSAKGKTEEKEIKAKLAPFAKTSMEFTPMAAGEFPFSCGMGMLHGKLIVR